MGLGVLLSTLFILSGSQQLDFEGWELYWEDNFDTLDLTKWDYEVTAWGGGVSILMDSPQSINQSINLSINSGSKNES